jgi:hypothetical protein
MLMGGFGYIMPGPVIGPDTVGVGTVAAARCDANVTIMSAVARA